MTYHFAVNPKQRVYYLEGQQQAMLAENPDPVPPVMEQGPSKIGDNMDAHIDAPIRKPSAYYDNQDDSLRPSSPKNETVKLSDRVPKTDLMKHKGIHDALDEAIEVAKAVKDLVCSLIAFLAISTNRPLSQSILMTTKG